MSHVPRDEARSALRQAAWALGYPDRRFWRLCRSLGRARSESGETSGSEGEPLSHFLSEISSRSEGWLEEHYVATFDFSPEHSLYLTSHEHGDDRARGTAMLALKKRIEEAGYFLDEGQLPDFLPLLLEFLSVAGLDPEDPVEPRLRAVADRIAASLETAQSPYVWVFRSIQEALPVVPVSLPRGRSDQEEEREPMPYPLQYGS